MSTWCMIDLETLGINPTCPVISLGAVTYSYKNGIYGCFHRFFNLDEQFRAGRLPQQQTLNWWLKQSEEARQSLAKDRTRLSVEEMVDEFFEFWREDVDDPVQDWSAGDDPALGAKVISNGANFDIAILSSLFPEVPWHYKNTRCFRSMIDWFGPVTYPEGGTKHDALSDARAQAQVHLDLMVKNEQLR